MTTLKNITQNLASLKERLDDLQENGMDEDEFDELLDSSDKPDYDDEGSAYTYSDILKGCNPVKYRSRKSDYTTSEIFDLETQIKDLKDELKEMVVEINGYKITPISKDHYWESFEDMPLLKDRPNYFVQNEAWSGDLYPLYICIKEDWGYVQTVASRNATKDQINYLIKMLNDHYF